MKNKGFTLIELIIVIVILLILAFLLNLLVFHKAIPNFETMKSVFHKSDELQKKYVRITKKADNFSQLPEDKWNLNKCNELIDEVNIVRNGIDERIQALTQQVTTSQETVKELNRELTNISIDQLKEKVKTKIKQMEESKNDLITQLQFWQKAQVSISDDLKKFEQCHRVLKTLEELEPTPEK